MWWITTTRMYKKFNLLTHKHKKMLALLNPQILVPLLRASLFLMEKEDDNDLSRLGNNN